MRRELLIGECARCGGNLTADHVCPTALRGIEMPSPEVKLKKFIVVPRDALELLAQRYADADDAAQAAEESCAENGQAFYVLEMKLVAARATPPVKVRKL